MENKLLNLTPIYLQNTDTILNTLLFMCLDQGHDFHDGSARTKTNDGKSCWVDLDLSGKGYLNKISASEFQNNYAPNSSDPKTIYANQIFGKNDFIKGLLNTTFVGGDGAYGLVIVDDIVYNNLGSNDDDISLQIKDFIAKQIDVQLIINEKYYITAYNDSKGEKGITIQISETDGVPNNILFLPFYQRVYNGDMHKLWTFNTKKHIFIIYLNKLDIVKEDISFKITNPDFLCKKFTTIDLIVPQYYVNFVDFLKSIKIPGIKGTITMDKLKGLNDEAMSKLFNQFAKGLFNGKFLEGTEDSDTYTSSNPDQPKYELDSNGIGQFSIDNQNNIVECIPRGVKYYFQDCQTQEFNYFLEMLFKYQKPFIHPEYITSSSKIDESKNYILNKLIDNNNELLIDYTKNKITKTIVDDGDDHFISKQYGFITDTNIGSGASRSTAENLIDKLNNVDENASCPMEGGARGDLTFLGLVDNQSDIKTIEDNKLPFAIIKNSIKKIFSVIINDEDKIKLFIDYLKNVFKDKTGDIDNILEKERTKQQTQMVVEPTTIPISLKRKADEMLDITTVEDLTPVSMKFAKPTEDVKETEFEKPIHDIQFDNINNVNKIFDLKLSQEKFNNKFVNINSFSTNKSINDYIKNYSNNLQLYYDFKQQTSSQSNDSTYFNNCWQSTDFYQRGGSDYPFKFTIASGSLDSSSLGGQSIPQYHPPEVDIYMPIFNLSGETNELKGVIVRMVFVKEVLINAINSKSQVIVFCHFVYVDFERTRISPPTNYTEYAIKLKQLLNYVVENTVTVKTEFECENIEHLKQNDTLNTADDIDFKLKLYEPTDSENNQTANRKWYKYYTFTQGPTVKDSIVIPTNFNSVDLIKLKAQFDYVATGILNVAENIIQNSKKLQEIFIGEEGKILFLKLFLIRNKYTGDKSRSTDTLFLNQTKYLEGVQISNDENTLYNSQMFGLNTIWSTSKKSVFYMAPYITPNNKMTITNGVFIKELCNGLANNPNNKVATRSDSKGSFAINEDTIKKDEIREEIMSKLKPKFIEDYRDCFEPTNSGNTELDKFIYTLTDCVFNLTYKLRDSYNEFINFCPMVQDLINKAIVDFKTSIENSPDEFQIRLKEIEIITNYIKYGDKEKRTGIVGKFIMFCRECGNIELMEVQLFGQLKKLIDKLKEKNECNYSTNELFNLILFINKNFPQWVSLIVKNYRLDAYKKYCEFVNYIVPKLKEIVELENSTTNAKKKIKNFVDGRLSIILGISNTDEDNIIKDCFKQSLTTTETISTGRPIRGKSSSSSQNPIDCSQVANFSNKIYLKEITPDDVENDTEDARKIKIEMNEKKYIKSALDLLDNFKINKLSVDENALKYLQENDLTNEEIDDLNRRQKNIESRLTIVRTRPISLGETEKEINKEPIYNIGGDMPLIDSLYPKQTNEYLKSPEPKTDITSKKESGIIIDKDNLQNFYKNSYKSNNGNYLKNFLKIINDISLSYNDDLIDVNADTRTIIIKILLKYINYINTTYTPIITTENIINDINKIDNSYSVEKINYVLNTYNSQLELYFLINNISTGENSAQDLIDIINENISDYQFKQLNLPFSKYQLINIIINQYIPNVSGGLKIKHKSFKTKHKYNKKSRRLSVNKKLHSSIKKRQVKLKRNTRRN